MSLSTRSFRRSAFACVALASLGVCALVGCGGGDDGDDAASTSSGGGSDAGATSSSGGSSGGGSSSGSPAGLKGTVTWKGTTEPCDVTDQDFAASGEYSVLCQTKGSATGFGTVLVQVTFKDEPSARTPGSFAPLGGSAFSPEDHPDPRTASAIVIDDEHAYAASDESTGTMTMAAEGGHHVLTVTDVQQFQPGEEDTPLLVSAVINF